jgi:hypothetical protein
MFANNAQCVCAQQRYEGDTGTFPLVRTTLQDTAITIDESSAEPDVHAAPVSGSFIVPATLLQPTATLQYTVAGLVTSATLSFTLTNTLPADGYILIDPPVEFPDFTPTEVVYMPTRYKTSQHHVALAFRHRQQTSLPYSTSSLYLICTGVCIVNASVAHKL